MLMKIHIHIEISKNHLLYHGGVVYATIQKYDARVYPVRHRVMDVCFSWQSVERQISVLHKSIYIIRNVCQYLSSGFCNIPTCLNDPTIVGDILGFRRQQWRYKNHALHSSLDFPVRSFLWRKKFCFSCLHFTFASLPNAMLATTTSVLTLFYKI